MLIGNLGRKPDVRYLESAPGSGAQTTKVATFPLATTEKYRDRDGNVRENTEWHNIVAWRGLADVVEKYADKGTKLFIEGHLRTRTYTDKAGATRYTTEIVADNLELLSRRPDASAQGSGYQSQGGYQNQGNYQGQSQGNSYQQPQRQAQSQPQAQSEQAQAPAPTQPADDLPAGDDLPF